MHITDNIIKSLPFQYVHKTALLQARPLTGEDYLQRGGIIYTLEGPVEFQPGDYLARGVQNEEWPITRDHFLADHERVTEPDSDEFAYYRATRIPQAYQVPEPFTVKLQRGDILVGGAGDYLVRLGNRMWIVERTIFEETYEYLSER